MPRAPRAALAADIPRRPAWQGTTRKARLPTNWPALRARATLRANGHCQCPTCPRCTANPCATAGVDVDHITRGDDHTLDNLQLLCGPCHAWKTTHERGRAPKRATE